MVKKSVIATIAVFSLVALIYISGVMFFSDRFPLQCTVNGTDVSGLTVHDAASALGKDVADYVLTVKGRGGRSFTVSASDIDLSVDTDALSKNAGLLYSAYEWPFNCISKNDDRVPGDVVYSRDTVLGIVKASPVVKASGVTLPKDAELEIVDGTCVVVPEEKGDKADLDSTMNAVCSAISALQDVLDLDEADTYVKPAVSADDRGLTENMDRVNREMDVTLTIDFGAGRREIIDRGLISEWLIFEDGIPGFDREKITDYVSGLGNKYNTAGKSRNFIKHDGTSYIITEGFYGWRINRGDTVDLIIASIEEMSDKVIEPVWTSEAKGYGEDDIGNTYVEIDLDTQHVWAYRDGEEVVSTDCVSGKAVNGSSTPNGIYPITYKEKDATLRGETYESHVDYWMPFNGNVGMHDAKWRSEFGGTIYLTSGSHGCVNLPASAAEEIFAIVEKNTPVIVYGGMNKEQALQYNLLMQQQMLNMLQGAGDDANPAVSP